MRQGSHALSRAEGDTRPQVRLIVSGRCASIGIRAFQQWVQRSTTFWTGGGTQSRNCSQHAASWGDGLVVEEYTGLMSWMEGPTRYTVVHSAAVAVLFLDTDPVDAIAFHHDLLGSDDPTSFFRLDPRT